MPRDAKQSMDSAVLAELAKRYDGRIKSTVLFLPRDIAQLSVIAAHLENNDAAAKTASTQFNYWRDRTLIDLLRFALSVTATHLVDHEPAKPPKKKPTRMSAKKGGKS